MSVHAYVCMSVCVYKCTYKNICVCMNIYTYIYTLIYIIGYDMVIYMVKEYMIICGDIVSKYVDI